MQTNLAGTKITLCLPFCTRISGAKGVYSKGKSQREVEIGFQISAPGWHCLCFKFIEKLKHQRASWDGSFRDGFKNLEEYMGKALQTDLSSLNRWLLITVCWKYWVGPKSKIGNKVIQFSRVQMIETIILMKTSRWLSTNLLLHSNYSMRTNPLSSIPSPHFGFDPLCM